MEGGAIRLALSGKGDGPMRGRVDATNFWVVNEPKLASIVSTIDDALQSGALQFDMAQLSYSLGQALNSGSIDAMNSGER